MSTWDDEAGYDLSDPKHPSFHDRYAGLWDSRDKTVPFRCVDPEAAWIADVDPGDENDFKDAA